MVDYYLKYQEQINKNYNEYDKYIDIYYSDNDKFKRKIKNDYLILYNKEQLIKIKKGKYINLYKEYNILTKDKNIILSKIDILLNESENENIEELKIDLININKSLESINQVFLEKKKLIENFENEDKNLNNELYNIYNKRKEFFDKFKNIINSKVLDKIKTIYLDQDNNKIDDHKLKIFSNSNNINMNDVKYVINWFINVKKYIKLQDKINIKTNEIKNKIMID